MVTHALKQAARHALGNIAPYVWRAYSSPRLVVLTYHRVLPRDHAEARIEQPGMQVRPETFAMHLDVLQKHFEIVELDDWIERQVKGQSLPRLACAITFDDGWKDNYDFAFAHLTRNRLPATLFVVTDMLEGSKSFWPNRLARKIRAHVDAGEQQTWPPALARLVDIDSSRGEPLIARIDRAICRCKAQASDAQMTQWLDSMEPQASSGERDLLNWEEVRAMEASGFVKVGSHTMHHIRLNDGVEASVIDAQVLGAKESLQKNLARPSNVFCYPNGDHCETAVRLVAKHHAAAVTTRRGWNNSHPDRYRLKRISIHEDISNTPARLLASIAAVF